MILRERVLPLAALLIAGDGPGHMVLGASLIEFQLRRARRAGAAHAVVFAERVSAALLASVERLRREGLSVDVARTVNDTAELIHPDEHILLLPRDVIIAEARLAALVGAAGSTVLCVRDEPVNDGFERIDATARWTGYALVDGALLRRTVAIIGDWDLASTVLRRAVQDGADRVVLTPDEAVRELDVLDNTVVARQAGRRLIRNVPTDQAGPAMRWMIDPAARLAARYAGEAGIEPRWVTMGTLVVFSLAIVCALCGWIVASLLLLLLGLLLDLSGDIGAHASAGGRPWEKMRLPTRAGAAVIVGLAMGTTLFMRSAQWGCLVLALITVVATWLAAPLHRDDAAFGRWRAEPSGHVVIGLVGFLVGSPIGALALAALHSAVTLIWVVRRAISRLASS